MSAKKSDLVPHNPAQWRVRGGDSHCNYTVPVNTYRAPKAPDGGYDPSVSATVPWPMSLTVLEEADESDPLNLLRVFCLKIGDELAYKLNFTDTAQSQMGEKGLYDFAMQAFLMLGVERGDEIRAALAAARDAAE